MSDQPMGTDWWLASDGKWYPPSAAPPPPPLTNRAVVDPLAGWLLTGGCAAVVLGSFLPWATITAPFVGTLSKAGTDGDGVMTLIGGGVAGAFGIALLRGSASRRLAIASLVLTALVLAIGIYDTVDVSSRISDPPSEFVDASVGVGLWITILGAGVAMAGSILWVRRLTATPRS